MIGSLTLFLFVYPSYKWFVAVYHSSKKIKQLTETQYVGTIHLITFWVVILVSISLIVFTGSTYKDLNIVMIYGNTIMRICVFSIVVTANNRIIRRRIAIDQVRLKSIVKYKYTACNIIFKSIYLYIYTSTYLFIYTSIYVHFIE